MILEDLPLALLREAKVNGFSDEQISRILEHGDEEDVYKKRKAAGITRVYKMVDTCSAEFEAKTPYFYSTLKKGNNNESKVSDKKKIIVLGSGSQSLSGRELNLIIAVYMDCRPSKNAAMKPSW
jgi:carbamoyl-phosphate synthase large subunit